MGIETRSMGTCSNALALVCVALALTNLEAVGEVEEIRDELRISPSEDQFEHYSQISGFSMVGAGAKEFANKEKTKCRDECSTDTECKSFSWKSPGNSDAEANCIISKRSLSYDSNYVMYTKKTNGKAGFRDFTGVKSSESSKLREVDGKSDTECQNICEADAQCKAFSYSIPEDNINNAKCILSREGILYSEAWTYYEKKGVEREEVETEGGVPPAPSPEEQATEDPNVQQLEIKLEAEKKTAEKEVADAKKAKAQAAAQAALAKAKEEDKEKFREELRKAQERLKNQEKEVEKESVRKMQAHDEKKELEFADAKIREDQETSQKL